MHNRSMFFIFFFFQAEDGIRDLTVTGVQTCALPIWVTTSGGTAGTLAVFTGSGTIGNSLLSQSGSTVSLSGTLSATSLSGNGASVTNVNAVTLQGNASSYFTNATNISTGTLADARLSSNVTLQGNTFNGASQLVQLNVSTQLPAVSGALLTNLNGSNVTS